MHMSWQQNIENLSELNRKIDQLLPVIDQLVRPPDQIILDDVQLREMLKMSKRSRINHKIWGAFFMDKVLQVDIERIICLLNL